MSKTKTEMIVAEIRHNDAMFVTALRQVGLLSEDEARCAIRCYLAGHPCYCEAVSHYCGLAANPGTIIEDAYRQVVNQKLFGVEA